MPGVGMGWFEILDAAFDVDRDRRSTVAANVRQRDPEPGQRLTFTEGAVLWALRMVSGIGPGVKALGAVA
jgi:hypothetical protein